MPELVGRVVAYWLERWIQGSSLCCVLRQDEFPSQCISPLSERVQTLD